MKFRNRFKLNYFIQSMNEQFFYHNLFASFFLKINFLNEIREEDEVNKTSSNDYPSGVCFVKLGNLRLILNKSHLIVHTTLIFWSNSL